MKNHNQDTVATDEIKLKSVKTLNIASLFANVGIAETYLNTDKIKVSVANEIEKNRVEYYNHMYPEVDMILGDITNKQIYRQILAKIKENKCQMIMATPPCQGMSVAGKRDINDSRNSLIIQTVNMIKDSNILYAIIENVPSMPNFLIKTQNRLIKIKDYLQEELQELYNINIEIINCADYGVPQNRKRCFVLISKKDYQKFKLPDKEKLITVRDAIGNLPSLESGETSNIAYHNAKTHNDNHIKWMKHTPSGKTALDNIKYFPNKNGKKIKGYSTTYKRIDWDKPAPTITMANGSVSSQNNVHPGRKNPDDTYSDARVLTLKEIFILSSLPNDYSPPHFASENLIRRVIGEGIPPLVVYKIINFLISNG